MTALDRRSLLAAAGTAALGAAVGSAHEARNPGASRASTPRGRAGAGDGLGGADPANAGTQDDRPGHTPHTRFAVNVEMWFGGMPFLDVRWT